MNDMELTSAFNANLLTLSNILSLNIQKINSMSVSKIIKIIKIDALRKTYNNSVAKLTIDYTNNKNKNKNNKRALLIGINYNNTPNQLYGCINDTNNIKNVLQTKFSYNNFTILTDLTNKKPVKQNIIKELTSLLVNAKSGDSLFFLYSGHGTYTIDLNGDELDGQDEMIVSLDATISDDLIKQIITNNLKKGVKLFMLFDSCFSGTVVDLKYNYFDNTATTTTTINSNETNTFGQVIMISGCKDSQTSADAVVRLNNATTYSGAMTYSFLKTIKDLGTKITYTQLLKNMRTILATDGYDQIPQLSSGILIDPNTFISI